MSEEQNQPTVEQPIAEVHGGDGEEKVKFGETQYEESAPVIEDKEPTGEMRYQPFLAFPNAGLDVLLMHGQGLENAATLGHYYTPKYLFSDRLTAEDASWVQHFKSDRGVLGPRRPRLASTGGNLTGRAAVEAVRKVGGMGGSLTCELFHTGIVVTMRPPLESELIDLEFAVSAAATQVGLSTTGLLLNGRSGVFSHLLVELACKLITHCNLTSDGRDRYDQLIDVVNPFDYGTLVWMMQSTMAANGYPWRFDCVHSECGATHNATINFSRMFWADKSRLTDKQFDILYRTAKSIDLDKITAYKDEFSYRNSTVQLEGGIVVHFQPGTMGEYLETASQWVDAIERQYNTAMTTYHTEERRNMYLQAQVAARQMGKYRHMVAKISIPADDGYDDIIDDKTIDSVLAELSTVGSNTTTFEQAAIEFISANTLVVIGYPAKRCKSCGFLPEGKNGEFKSIVPVAIDRVFFTLARQRVLALSKQVVG